MIERSVNARGSEIGPYDLSHLEALLDLEELLIDPPIVHGEPMTLQVPVCRFLSQRIRTGQQTLETGCGLSTLVFALAGAQHTVIVPDPEEESALREWAARRVDLSGVTFEIGPSQDVLPRLRPSGLSVVLIDGRHGFPAPYIDWYYAGQGLLPGGLMVVDDTQIWTGFELMRMMSADPGWRLVADFAPRSAAFERIGEESLDREWSLQPYIVRMSRLASSSRIVDLVRKGEFAALATKIGRHIPGTR